MSKTGISNTALLVGGFGLVRYFSHAVPVSKLSEMQHMLPSMLNLCCALRIVRSDFSSSFLCISYLSIVPVWNAVSPTIKQLCCSSVDEYREKVSVKCTHCAHEVTATSSSFFFSLLFFFDDGGICLNFDAQKGNEGHVGYKRQESGGVVWMPLPDPQCALPLLFPPLFRKTQAASPAPLVSWEEGFSSLPQATAMQNFYGLNEEIKWKRIFP